MHQHNDHKHKTTLQMWLCGPEVKGINLKKKREWKVKRKRAVVPALLLHLKHTSMHAHALQLSVCLSGPVSWLQGLWDSPARWQPFLSRAGKTGSQFCVCAPLTHTASKPASVRACALFIFYLFASFLFFKSVTAARLRTPICIAVRTKGKKSGSTNRRRRERMN